MYLYKDKNGIVNLIGMIGECVYKDTGIKLSCHLYDKDMLSIVLTNPTKDEFKLALQYMSDTFGVNKIRNTYRDLIGKHPKIGIVYEIIFDLTEELLDEILTIARIKLGQINYILYERNS